MFILIGAAAMFYLMVMGLYAIGYIIAVLFFGFRPAKRSEQ